MKILKSLQKDRRGEIFVELIVKILTITVIILFALNIFDIVIKYQHVTYMSKSITKTIEQEGAVNSIANDKLDALNTNFNTKAKYNVSNVKYFNALEGTIQFRDSFTVTVSDNYKLTILDPLFASPLVLDIPMSSTITGMSEVYWK